MGKESPGWSSQHIPDETDMYAIFLDVYIESAVPEKKSLKDTIRECVH